MNLTPPFELLGHVFLAKPDEYTNHHRTRIMDVTLEHDNTVNCKFVVQYIGWVIPIMFPYLELINQMTVIRDTHYDVMQ